ncbi:MAG: hypothetical protein AAGG50_15415, partial [Bacteroidota bacterium]
MGKGLLIAALANSLLIVFATSRSSVTLVEMTRSQVEYSEDILAREIARSGYEVAHRAAERGYNGGTGTLDEAILAVNDIANNRPFQGGTWRAEAHTIDAETALLRVTGEYNGQTYTTEGLYLVPTFGGPILPDPPLLPDWTFDCASNRSVDVYAMGIGSYGIGTVVTPATLTIPDPASVRAIHAQATVKSPENSSVDAFTFTTDTGESVTLSDPTAIHQSLGAYSTALAPAGEVTLTATLNSTGSWHAQPRSFTLYVVRERAGYFQTGGIVEKDVWRFRDPEHTKVLTIPGASQPRDVRVQFSLGDTTDDGRYHTVTATAGSVTRTIRTQYANRGAQASLFDVVLPAVPGGVTEVR